jgi:hypothetical protein
VSRRAKQQTPLQPTDDYWRKFIDAKFGTELPIPTTEVPKSPFLTEETETGKELSRDMLVFAYRVAERLTPLDGLSEEARDRALKIREAYRQQLQNVFLGREDFQAWFTRTRTERGLHLVDFTKMLYESLQGLRSPEAHALREQYAETLAKLKSAYSM